MLDRLLQFASRNAEIPGCMDVTTRRIPGVFFLSSFPASAAGPAGLGLFGTAGLSAVSRFYNSASACSGDCSSRKVNFSRALKRRLGEA
jgi:hypothetical protein